MYFDLLIKNGFVVTPYETYKADIGVKDEKIAAVGNLKSYKSSEMYDAQGLYVFPGFIDEHVHSRDPGLTHKEDFYHTTMAAAAGGITTVIEMPNSVPPVMDVDAFYNKNSILKNRAFVDYALLGMVLGDMNTEKLPALSDAGVVGFKLFWGYALNPKTYALVYNFSTNDDVVMPPDEGQIFDAFYTIGKTGKPVAIHAENSVIISRLASRLRSKGENSYADFLLSRPPFTEVLTIQTGVTIAHAADAHLHILHIAAGEGVDIVAAARESGQNVTGETCPHYLRLSAEDFPSIGVNMKIYPPIREKVHQEKLWESLRNGHLQSVGSDHAPHTDEEKIGNIWDVPAGATGVQTIVPVMLDSVANGKISPNLLAAVLSENPARIWGLYGKKGVIMPEADADFTIVDMEQTTVIRKEELLSKSHVTPYDGLTCKGAPVASFVRGRQIMSQARPVTKPIGELVKPVTESQARW